VGHADLGAMRKPTSQKRDVGHPILGRGFDAVQLVGAGFVYRDRVSLLRYEESARPDEMFGLWGWRICSFRNGFLIAAIEWVTVRNGSA